MNTVACIKHSVFKNARDLISYYDKTTGYVQNIGLVPRTIFIATNLVYAYPLFMINFNIDSAILFFVGLTSGVFHGKQCCCGISRDIVLQYMRADVIVSSTGGAIVFYNNVSNIDQHVVFYMIFALYCYIQGGYNYKNSKMYIIYHGLWHLYSGLMFIYLLT